MNRALLVVRLSRMTDETTSPERQLAATKGEAERRNLKIVGVAEDLNVSASKVSPFRRPVLGPWLTEKFGEFDVIIWARLDRAVRSMGDLHELAKWAKERGKRLIFASGPGDQMESQSNSERVIGAQAYLRQVGRWGGGMVPYGLRPVPFDGDGKKGWKLVHEPTTAPIVKEMVERVIAGHAQLAIARDLQRRGVPTPRDFQDQQNGRDRGKARKWSVPAVGKILRSRALLGETMHNGQLVRDADGAPILRAEPLVTETEWGQLQAALADRAVTRVRTQTPHLLLGVIKCGGCGGPLYRQQYAKKGRPYVYFRCSGYMVEHNGCNERFRSEAIERGFQAIFLARVGHLEVERREFVAGHDNTDDLLNLDRLLLISKTNTTVVSWPIEIGTSNARSG